MQVADAIAMLEEDETFEPLYHRTKKPPTKAVRHTRTISKYGFHLRYAAAERRLAKAERAIAERRAGKKAKAAS